MVRKGGTGKGQARRATASVNARLAAVAVSGALAMGTMAGVPAFADSGFGSGEVTIVQAQGNVTEFVGYQLFKAHVSDDSTSPTGKSATDVTWASPEVQAAVEGVAGERFATAQDAADWIEAHITNTTETTRIEAGSFANKLAAAVSGTAPAVAAEGSKPLSGVEEGYWLFTTSSESLDAPGEMGSAPLFIAVGGSPVKVVEKTDVVTAGKTVLNNEEGSAPSSCADAARGSKVSFTLSGSVPDNIGSFSAQGARFVYRFEDVLSAGLDCHADSVRVSVDGTDVTSSFAVSFDDASHTLSVSCDHLEAIARAGSTVLVTYDASLNQSAVLGGAGNPNTAVLRYSDNPNTDHMGSTAPSVARTYSFGVSLLKVDRTTEAPLAGAHFTIADSSGKYVQEDGSVGDSPYEFVSAEDGAIHVEGLDRGVYTVHETAAPSRYQVARDFSFTIEPSYDESGALASLSSAVDGSSDAVSGLPDGTVSDHVLTARSGTGAEAATGIVRVTVGDTKASQLPLTGDLGAVAAVTAGVAAIAGGAALGAARRRNGRSRRIRHD